PGKEGTANALVPDAEAPPLAGARPTLPAMAATAEGLPAARGEPHEPSAERQNLVAPWSGVPRPTRYAGLFFLLPALERLGIAPWRGATRGVLELAPPGRLLEEVARDLAVTEDDPVRAALPAMPSGGEAARCDFTAPACWQGLCGAGPRLIRRLAGGGGARLLSDRSGQLALALWRGRAPAEVRQLLGDSRLRRGSAAAPARDFAV